MKAHYLLGVAILVAGGTHIATHSFLGTESYAKSLRFDETAARYGNSLLAVNLEVLLVAVTYHTVNGLRVILIEWKQGPKWERGVKWFAIILAVILIAAGTYTIMRGPSLALA